MKTLKFNGGGYAEYSAPSVTALEVVVENGFAASATIGGSDKWDDDETFA